MNVEIENDFGIDAMISVTGRQFDSNCFGLQILLESGFTSVERTKQTKNYDPTFLTNQLTVPFRVRIACTRRMVLVARLHRSN